MFARWKCLAITWMLAPFWLIACATLVVGSIQPSAFEFHPVVAVGGVSPGGWMVAQVAIQLGHSNPSGQQAVWCDIEVGLPQVNYLGPVTEETARIACAAAADQAARFVLQQKLAVSALVCKRFQEKMEELLSRSIPGVRVTRFQTPGIRPRRFPDGDDLGRRLGAANPGLALLTR